MRPLRTLRALATSLVMVMTLSACDFSIYNLPLPGGADLGDDSYAVKVEFRDVLDLVPQSAVKVDEVTVGKVEDVTLDGYTAVVTVRLNGDVKLPQNSLATIRQTSLLGEKFVELAPPADEAETGRLADGDTIPLSRTGRNPEVEEVLGALSLLLNGGGVAQLRTIARELNKAMKGREPEIRDALAQLEDFVGQLDKNKQDIVAAIRSVNALAIDIKKQKSTIVSTLEEMPEALKVLDQQRSGLVKMLKALQRLNPVATRVIRASKQDTVANLRALDPILGQLANAGDAFPKAFQVFLTYPFVNATVGETPTEARNLHMGDYTNLSAQLEIDLGHLLPQLPDVCAEIPDLPICNTPLPDPCDVIESVTAPVTLPVTLPASCSTSIPTSVPTDVTTVVEPVVNCLRNPTLRRCTKPIRDLCEANPTGVKCQEAVEEICRQTPDSPRCRELTRTLCSAVEIKCQEDGGGGSTTAATATTGNPVCTLPVNLCRRDPGYSRDRFAEHGLDKDLALLLMQGVSR